jgi:LPS export ABC transporter protein LptC
MRQLLFAILFLCSISSCVVDQADLSKYMAPPIENLEEARDINITYTDSSRLVFILKAPLLHRTYNKYSVEEEFPEGIDVTFYDKSGNEQSWLTSDYAIRDQTQRTVIVEKNVVLRNKLGERLEGPELIWDEKTKEIRTDRFVKITKPDGTLVYSYGFKSNESFTRYELNASSGRLAVEEKDK